MGIEHIQQTLDRLLAQEALSERDSGQARALEAELRGEDPASADSYRQVLQGRFPDLFRVDSGGALARLAGPFVALEIKIKTALLAMHIKAQLKANPASLTINKKDPAMSLLQRKLAQDMEEHPEIYEEGRCLRHVEEMLINFLSAEERAKARVLVLINPLLQSTRQFRWINGRSIFSDRFRISAKGSLKPGEKWKYHVVLELGGRIYDDDYRGRPGTSINDYAQEMFAGREVDVTAIPATSFLEMISPLSEKDKASALVGYVIAQPDQRARLKDFAATAMDQFGPQEPFVELRTRQELVQDWGTLAGSSLQEKTFVAEYYADTRFTSSHFAVYLQKTLLDKTDDIAGLESVFLKLVIPKTHPLTSDQKKSLEKATVQILHALGFKGSMGIHLYTGHSSEKMMIVNNARRYAELFPETDRNLPAVLAVREFGPRFHGGGKEIKPQKPPQHKPTDAGPLKGMPPMMQRWGQLSLSPAELTVDDEILSAPGDSNRVVNRGRLRPMVTNALISNGYRPNLQATFLKTCR